MDTVGKRIRKIRNMRGWTQKHVAAKAGLHEVAYQYYELGTRKAKMDTLLKIANALEVDVAFLQPTKTDTPMAMFALLFDLIEDYGDITIENTGGKITIGVDPLKYFEENLKLRYAWLAHKELSMDEFKKWLIDYSDNKKVN